MQKCENMKMEIQKGYILRCQVHFKTYSHGIICLCMKLCLQTILFYNFFVLATEKEYFPSWSFLHFYWKAAKLLQYRYCWSLNSDGIYFAVPTVTWDIRL